MKVTKITSLPIQDEEGRVYFFVKIDTDKGIHGLGEVGIARQGNAIAKAIEHLSELVIGSDPWETERLWQLMYRSSFFPADKVYSCAISAIDIALWDIKGKSVGMPVYKLLGGPYREKVICYPHTQGNSLKEFLDICEDHLNKGWKFLRWHQPSNDINDLESNLLDPRKSIKNAVEVMGEVRNKFGYEPEIAFDVHTRLDPPEVIEMCKELESLKPFFIEDPLRSESPHAYRNLSKHTSLPIAAGEQWSSKWQFRQVIEEDLINYARIDLCIVGGITEAKKITNWAETHYIDIVPHNPLGAVSAAACVSLCMASTNVGVQEMPRRPGTEGNDIFPVQISWEDGYAWCNDMPGLGIEFDSEAAEQYRTTPGGFPPYLTRNDGAFTNW